MVAVAVAMVEVNGDRQEQRRRCLLDDAEKGYVVKGHESKVLQAKKPSVSAILSWVVCGGWMDGRGSRWSGMVCVCVLVLALYS